jgi:LuxR family transcriptional activator of bioluminescence operon
MTNKYDVPFDLPSCICKLEQATSIKAADHCLRDALKEMGFDRFAYTYYGNDFSKGPKLRHSYATPNLREWHEHFHESGYENDDPIAKRVRTSLIPVVWNVHKTLATAHEKFKHQFEESIEWGNCAGVSIPIFGPKNSYSILTLHDNNIENKVANTPLILSLMHQLTIYYHYHLSRVLIEDFYNELAKDLLTEREQQCLTLTAQNHNAEEVASLLKISKRTVNFHIENINKKLKTKNKFESVQLALAKKIIHL